MNVVNLVRAGKGIFDFKEIVSEKDGYKLYIKVFRDAMKFDGMPAMNWRCHPIPGDDRKFDSVRLPASAFELQQIADLLNCMLMTTKVIDMIWLQANIKFDCVTYINTIVANSNIHDVHNAIEKKIRKAGGDDGKGLISCVGKYWCLINGLGSRPGRNLYGKNTACNYGWMSSKGSGPCLSPGTKCWQRPGFKHNNKHYDPSQTIRLMYKYGRLIHPDGKEETVDLVNILKDEKLSYLINHEGKLDYFRQKNVPELAPIYQEPEQEPPKQEPLKIKDKVELYATNTNVANHKLTIKKEINYNLLQVILKFIMSIVNLFKRR